MNKINNIINNFNDKVFIRLFNSACGNNSITIQGEAYRGIKIILKDSIVITLKTWITSSIFMLIAFGFIFNANGLAMNMIMSITEEYNILSVLITAIWFIGVPLIAIVNKLTEHYRYAIEHRNKIEELIREEGLTFNTESIYLEYIANIDNKYKWTYKNNYFTACKEMIKMFVAHPEYINALSGDVSDDLGLLNLAERLKGFSNTKQRKSLESIDNYFSIIRDGISYFDPLNPIREEFLKIYNKYVRLTANTRRKLAMKTKYTLKEDVVYYYD